MKVYFSPSGGCRQAVLDLVAGAKEQVLVLAYEFTDLLIAAALVAARARGLDVRFIGDERANSKPKSVAKSMASSGVPCWLDGAHPIMHDKVVVLDGKTVITGSYNFTLRAEHGNAENLLVIHDERVALLYRENWFHHLSHSKPSVLMVTT